MKKIIYFQNSQSIGISTEKNFLQLAHMRWEHKKEDDAIYGEDNIKGIESDEFIKEYINFLKTERRI